MIKLYYYVKIISNFFQNIYNSVSAEMCRNEKQLYGYLGNFRCGIWQYDNTEAEEDRGRVPPLPLAPVSRGAPTQTTTGKLKYTKDHNDNGR